MVVTGDVTPVLPPWKVGGTDLNVDVPANSDSVKSCITKICASSFFNRLAQSSPFYLPIVFEYLQDVTSFSFVLSFFITTVAKVYRSYYFPQ